MESIGSEELHQLLRQSDVQLVDVRTPEEVSFGYIAGAKHIDFYHTDFMDRITQLDKKKPVVVYCAVGGRSAQASRKLSDAGFEKVYDLAGGFRQWQSEGFPTEQSSNVGN
ncbi:MAG: rhodanese-like domain-containing protein [Tunicatimonas sp.]